MLKIEALIRPTALENVRAALIAEGIRGMTVWETRGTGTGKGKQRTYRGATIKVDFVPKLKIEIVIAPEQRDTVINAIVEAARTGEVGDGKIFVTPVQETIRIRTGESGDNAV